MGKGRLLEFAIYHYDVVSSLRLYFSEASPSFASRFFERRRDEVAAELANRLELTDLRSSFFVLTNLEHCFRGDYEFRCKRKMKDPVSRAFRQAYKLRDTRVNLDEDIFQVWAEHSIGSQRLIGELRSAFKFRNWVAHGQYGEPKLGRKYDFSFIYGLADDVLNAFHLYESD